MNTTSSSTQVLRKSFLSRGAYAAFALSDEAPRFSVAGDIDASPDMAATYGVRPGEALFSDDIRSLQRAVVNWDQNGYNVLIERGAESKYASATEILDDNWALRAGPSVPSWFPEQFYGDLTDELEASVLARENAALDCIFDSDGGISVRDKQDNAADSYLQEVVRDKNEAESWSYTGFD